MALSGGTAVRGSGWTEIADLLSGAYQRVRTDPSASTERTATPEGTLGDQQQHTTPTSSTMDLTHTWMRQLSGRSSDDEDGGAGPPDIEANTGTAAASAERHRLANSTSLDLQAFIHWVEQCAPYLTLLVALFVYSHSRGLFVIIWLSGAIKWTNQTIRRQISLKKEAKFAELLGGLVTVAANVVCVLWLTSEQQLWRQLALLPPIRLMSAWQLILAFAIVDSLVRLAWALPKMLVVAGWQRACSSPTSLRQQARMLTFLEYCAMLYRSLIPVAGWYVFFISTSVGEILSSLLAGFYLSLKAASLWQSLRLALVALQLLMRKGAAFGKFATRDEVTEAGNVCAICQDPMSTAIKLECSHVFCEDCINEWLERDRTCPMCRADVKPQGLQSFGDGSTHMLPQLF